MRVFILGMALIFHVPPMLASALVLPVQNSSSLIPVQTPLPSQNNPGIAPAPPADPKEIVRRSVEKDHHNFERSQKYTCTQRQVIKHLDKHGNVKSTETKTYDINFYFGEFYSKLVQIDDKPLSAKDQAREDEKLEKFLAKRRKESEEDREKRVSRQEKERQEGRAFCDVGGSGLQRIRPPPPT